MRLKKTERLQSAANHAKNIIRNEIYNIVYHQGDPYITLDALNDALKLF